eukprot:Gb_05067 [translate_table: standard]
MIIKIQPWILSPEPNILRGAKHIITTIVNIKPMIIWTVYYHLIIPSVAYCSPHILISQPLFLTFYAWALRTSIISAKTCTVNISSLLLNITSFILHWFYLQWRQIRTWRSRGSGSV